MPDKRSHRGPHPQDKAFFAREQWPRMREAVADYSWLLGRDYAETAARKIVGDHYALHQRQRLAVMRSACSDQALRNRRQREVLPEQLVNEIMVIDGYNVLTTTEAALADGVLLLGRDGCIRDMASMHGTFRAVDETLPAVRLLGDHLEGLHVGGCIWHLDRPVSNSGRLKVMMLQAAAECGWNWQVELSISPDRVLSESEHIVATADSVILDRCRRWFNLARHMVARSFPDLSPVDLAV